MQSLEALARALGCASRRSAMLAAAVAPWCAPGLALAQSPLASRPAAASAGGVAPAAPSLAEFVRRIDRVHRGSSTAAVVRMDIHAASVERSYSMVYWSRESATGEDVLIKVLGPAQWRGQGNLKLAGRLTMYNPRTGRATLLSSSMLGDNWMGSHFTNDDLIHQTQLDKEYSYRETKTWEQPRAEGRARYASVELVSLPKAAVVWERIELEGYRQDQDVVPTKMSYFRRRDERTPQRTLEYGELKLFGGRRVPSSLTVTVADKPGEYTRLTYEDLRFDAAIPASKFSEQSLEQ